MIDPVRRFRKFKVANTVFKIHVHVGHTQPGSYKCIWQGKIMWNA